MAGLFLRPAIFVFADLVDIADISECYFSDAEILSAINLMIQIILVNLFQ